MKAAGKIKMAIATGVSMACLRTPDILSSKTERKETSGYEQGADREPGSGGTKERAEAATQAAAAVREFVDRQEAFSWRGLSLLDKAGEPEFGRWLTVSLRSLLTTCKGRVPEYIQSHPGHKVPFPEGSALSGTYGAVHDWRIDGIETPDNRLALVRITVLSSEGEGDSTPDGIVLVMISEAGGWRLDDVYHTGSNGSLRTALRFLLLE